MDGSLILFSLSKFKISYIIHFATFFSEGFFSGFFLSSPAAAFFSSFFSLSPVTSSVNFLNFSYSPEKTQMELDKGLINSLNLKG